MATRRQEKRTGLEVSAVDLDRDATANYLVDMIGELEAMARASKRELLAYLLAIASAQAAAPERGDAKDPTSH
ncbi:MAG: hypothetical protein ACLPN5_14010 [Roseiarcus sp.]